MEDAHIARLDFNDNSDLHLFAIFDGHGGLFFFILLKERIYFGIGKDVADYC